MPSLEKHIELSIKRTGKEYREVHEWLDGDDVSFIEKLARHNFLTTSKFLPVVERKFGKEGVIEYIHHLEDDYNSNIALKTLKKIFQILSP